MRNSSRESTDRHRLLDGMAANARSIGETDGEAIQTPLFADVCANRAMELREQELRSRVVNRSLNRIDCVLGFVLLLTSIKLLGPATIQVSGATIAALTLVANVVIATSTRTIGRALRRRR